MKEELANHNFAEYFKYYISLVEDDQILNVLHKNNSDLKELFDLLIEDNGSYRYAEGKWSIKELLVHLIDTERIFCYRALCIARNEKNDLLGFDHDEYVKNSDANERTLYDIAKEFDSVRKSTITLFENFSPNMLNATGTAAGNKLTVMAIGYLIVGHAKHHMNVLEEKYL
jgi:hypothetical protein